MAVTPIWPAGSNVNEQGEITFHGRTAESLLNEFGSPLYVIDTDDVRARATKFVKSAANAFNNTVTHVSFAGKAQKRATCAEKARKRVSFAKQTRKRASFQHLSLIHNSEPTRHRSSSGKPS